MTVAIRVTIPLNTFDEPGVRRLTEQFATRNLLVEIGLDDPITIRWEFYPIGQVAVCEASNGATDDDA